MATTTTYEWETPDGADSVAIPNDMSGLAQAIEDTVKRLMPLGVPLPYVGSTAPTGYVFCHGQELSRTTYSDLFDVIGTAYGAGDGSTTFNVPDFRGRALVGADEAAGRLPFASQGDTGGASTVTLSASQLPAHTHSVNLTSDSAGAHTHDSGTLATNTTGSHTHGSGTYGTDTESSHNHSFSDTVTSTQHDHALPIDFQIGDITGAGGSAVAIQGTQQSTGDAFSGGEVSGNTSSDGSHSHDVNGSSSSAGSHSHSISGDTASAGSHNHSITGDTGSVGSGASHENMPPYQVVTWILRTEL